MVSEMNYTFVGFVFVFLVFCVGAAALTQVLQFLPLGRCPSPSCRIRRGSIAPQYYYCHTQFAILYIYIPSMMWSFSSSVVLSSAKMTSSVGVSRERNKKKRMWVERIGRDKTRQAGGGVRQSTESSRNLMREMCTKSTCFADPFNVAVEFALQLLLTAQFQESLPIFYALPLLGKFPIHTVIQYALVRRRDFIPACTALTAAD